MDSYSSQSTDETHRLRHRAEIDLELAIRQAAATARQIVELNKGDDLGLLGIIKFNAGDVGRLDAQTILSSMIHRAALRQLYINHDQRNKQRGEMVI